MGQKDTITKERMSQPKYFADAFNYYLYGGKSVINTDSLHILDPTEIAVVLENGGKEITQKVRDVLKQCIIMRDDKISYVILGIENQSEVHYAMPVKNMIYDALNYGAQVTNIARKHREEKQFKNSTEFLSGLKKADKLKPVITLTIYFGADEWDGPRSLHEMFPDIDENLLKFVDDYKLNLIIPNEIEDFTKFSTDLGKALRLISASRDKEKMEEIQKDESFRSVDNDMIDIVNVITNSKFKKEKGKETIDMCLAIEQIKEEGALLKTFEYVEKKIISPAIAAENEGMSQEELFELMKQYGFIVPRN